MDRVSGWWMGALRVPSRSQLFAMAQRVGSWSQFEHCGVDDLVDLGVDPSAARAWIGTGDAVTRGVAVTRADDRYPRCLQGDERAPPVLFVEGDPQVLLQTPSVAIIGTRSCSARGSALARTLSRRLALEGEVVVSGLARGIDAAAHDGAINPGLSIAVLGHGLAHQAPRSNTRLRRRLVDSGGAVVSGWPDTVRPERWTFPVRNRWVAGLSRAVVVVEAPKRSGALITCRDALELGRQVWACPGRIGDPLAQGPNDLIARQLADGVDVEALMRLRLDQLLEHLAERSSVPAALSSALAYVTRAPQRGRVRVLSDVDEFVRALGLEGASRQPAWMSQLLSGSTVEQVASTWGLMPCSLRRELTRRELAGELVRLPGGRYGEA